MSPGLDGSTPAVPLEGRGLVSDGAGADAPPARPPAGRRLPRPRAVERCQACGGFVGRGYLSCPACHDAVERHWRADWDALLVAEGIAAGSDEERLLAEVVVAELDRHPWTLIDYAMTLLRCPECGEELGGGPAECGPCAMAFGNLWAPGVEAGATMNEHALRVGRWVARHPHRHSAHTVAGWRLSLPLLLTGQLPSTAEAQAIRAWLDTGRGDELADYRSFAEVYEHTRRGRR